MDFATLLLWLGENEEISLNYADRVRAVHKELGIPDTYAEQRGLRLQSECTDLTDAGIDLFGRELRMTADTLAAWLSMRDAAAGQDIELQLVSAYRSLEYQKQLFLKKLDAGQTLDEILAVIAAPGYSEHHSGRALDLTCPDSACLETSFEDTEAFAWLKRHAGSFYFRLSFPRGNSQGFLYEPWHWYFEGS